MPSSEYKWSSDGYYRKNKDKDVDIEVILDTISEDRKKAIEQYKEFMQGTDNTEYQDKTKIGQEAFELIIGKRDKVALRKRLDEILFETGVSPQDYKFLTLNYTYKDIGQNIMLSDAA